MSSHPLAVRPFCFPAFLLAGLVFPCLLGANDTLWELTNDREGNDVAWRVDRGRMSEAGGGEGLKIEPEHGSGFRMYRYVEFDFSDMTRPHRFLQIKAQANSQKAIGIITDVSRDGGVVGAWTEGVTTFDLLNTPAFKNREGKKGTWALSLFSNADFVINSITCSAEVTDGIVFERESGDGDLNVKAGDKLRVKAFTSDALFASLQQIDAEVVWRDKGAKNAVKAWSGDSGPALSLSRTGEGLFEGVITLDSQMTTLMSSGNGPAVLGVRLLSGSQPLLGWAPYTAAANGEAGPIDWEEKVGAVTGSHEQWRLLTTGEELARGLPVQLIPKPDYRLTTDENDRYDLTDGQLSSRMDDRIWFQKDAVGWYLNTTGRQISMVVDLGKLQPVGRIAIRLLAGQEQNALRLPSQIEFLASDDGKNYHVLQSMVKLMAAEAELSDFKKAFYVSEDGKAFVQAFECTESVQARFIAIRIHPEASVFSDEISIQKAPSVELARPVSEFPETTLLTTGIAIKPRQPVISITGNAVTPNWFMIEEGEVPPYQTHSLALTLPQGIVFVASDFFQSHKEEHNEEKGTRTYYFENIQALKRRNFSLYLKRDPALQVPQDAKAQVASLIDGKLSHLVEAPLQVLTFPDGPLPALDISLAWMHEGTQQRWPDYAESFRKMGFRFMSLFPRFWQRRDANRSWLPDVKQRGLSVVQSARENGYQLVMNDSPFAEMKHTIMANLASNRIEASELKDLALQAADGSSFDVKKADFFNPFYRGRFYQMEIQRIEDLVRLTQPDHIYWDIEIWWRSAARAQNDPRLKEMWKQSGVSWEDFITSAGTEMVKDLREAVKRAMGDKPLPVIGGYHIYGTQTAPSDGLFEWKKVFPEYLDISMPSLYVQGRVADVAQRVRDEYAKVGRDVIPWLTPGTYGPVEPTAMEPMVLETILNGARGFTYYEYADFDPAHFYHHARALSLLGRFPDLLKKGKPVPIEGSNAGMHYTCFSSREEGLLLIGNYARTPRIGTEINLPAGFAKAMEVVHEGEKALNSEGALLKASILPGAYRLFHLKR